MAAHQHQVELTEAEGASYSEVWRVVSGILFVHLPRIGVGLLFIYLGLKKTGDPVDFLKELKQYDMFPLDPPHFINATAVTMPWLEVILGLALVAGLMRRAAGITAAGMLAVFTTAIFLRAMNFPEYIAGELSFWQIRFDCGCGSGVVTVWKKLGQNTLMGLLMLPVAFMEAGPLFRLRSVTSEAESGEPSEKSVA